MSNIGNRYTADYEVSLQKIENFADATGDYNPIHFDKEYAAKTPFKRPIAHGILVTGFISSTITEFFGEGAIYLEQNTKFVSPV